MLLNNTHFALFPLQESLLCRRGRRRGIDYICFLGKNVLVCACVCSSDEDADGKAAPRNKLPARGSPSAFEGVGILPDLIVEYFLLRVQEGRNFIGRTGRRTNGGGIENRTQEVVGQENSLR